MCLPVVVLWCCHGFDVEDKEEPRLVLLVSSVTRCSDLAFFAIWLHSLMHEIIFL